MATNIVGVTMPTPASDPGISTNGNFTMGGVITTAGGGTAYECSENSNEISFSVWIPAAAFSVPVNFRILPE